MDFESVGWYVFIITFLIRKLNNNFCILFRIGRNLSVFNEPTVRDENGRR